MSTRRLLPLLFLTATLLGWRFFFAPARAENLPRVDTAIAAASAPTDGYLVGAAERDITPDLSAAPLQLHCYGEREKKNATGVLDPLHVRAITVADARGHRVALVSADLCYINSEVRDLLVERLAPHGYGEDHLLLAGTHTHSGCAGYDRRWAATKFFGDFQPALLTRVVDGIADAVLEARRREQPAIIEYASAEIDGFNRSRRDPAFDINTGGHPAGVVPDPIKYPTDRRLTVVRFRNRQGSPLAVSVHFASHATILSPKNMQVSADWPGEMTRRVQTALGGQTPVMFFNGSLGDAAPPPDWAPVVETEIRQMREYGAQMAEQVLRLLPQVRPMQRCHVAGFTARRNFDRATLRFAWGIKLPRFLTHWMIWLRPDAPFQAVRVGDLVLLAVPGEPTTAVGAQIKALVTDRASLPLIVAPANDYLAYFTTPAEYDVDGYESDSTLFGRDTATRVTEAMGRAVRNLETAP